MMVMRADELAGPTISIANPSQILDVDHIVDNARLGAVHVKVFLLCVAVAFCDGMDSLAIGAASTLIGRDLSIPTAQFGPIFSSMVLGGVVGAAIFGKLGDKFGRKPPLILATVIFGSATLATAVAQSFEYLLITRFIVGIGLGGATPCFLALGTEYAPKVYRKATTAVLWAGYSLGVALGGFVNAIILADGSWRLLFVVQGLIPLMLVPLLVLFLPESLRFLVTRGAPSSRVLPIARSLDKTIAADSRIAISEVTSTSVGPSPLDAPPPARAILALYLAAAFVFASIKLVYLWSPALLATRGVNASSAAALLGVAATFGLLGNIAGGPLISWVGARRSSLLLVLAAGCQAMIGIGGSSFADLVVPMAGVGFGLGVSAGLVLSIAAQLFPASRRSAGLGMTMACGRSGQVAAPLMVSTLLVVGLSENAILTLFGVLLLVAVACIFPLGRRVEGAD